MGEVIQFPARHRRQADRYFGGCPFCGGLDGIVDAGSASWCVCQRHHVRWRIGPKTPDNQESWKYKIKGLHLLREVAPVFPEDSSRA